MQKNSVKIDKIKPQTDTKAGGINTETKHQTNTDTCKTNEVCVINLSVKYDEKIIFSGLNMAFAQGKINAILGGSGVGKTTLLNAIAGLKTYDGEVCGTEGGISYIFQKDRLIPSISVYKNLDLILKAKTKGKSERKKAIMSMLEKLEIAPYASKLPGQLSGGQAQRVAMARAFLYPSNILLMDEPFRALDSALKLRLLALLCALNDEMPRTIIFVTHAIDECLLAADKYFVLGSAQKAYNIAETASANAAENSAAVLEKDCAIISENTTQNSAAETASANAAENSAAVLEKDCAIISENAIENSAAETVSASATEKLAVETVSQNVTNETTSEKDIATVVLEGNITIPQSARKITDPQLDSTRLSLLSALF